MQIIEEGAGVPAYQQIYAYFVKEIRSGRCEAGSRLPSIRTLCRELNVSKTTVEHAYAELSAEGYVQSVPASGYVVTGGDAFWSDGAQQRHGKSGSAREKVYCFYNGLSENFPLSLWRKLTHQALSSGDIDKINFYGNKQGEDELREEIARYLHASRGIDCSPEQIVMANGLQYALEIIAKLIPADRLAVAMEEPGYRSARDVFINNRYRIVPVPVEEDGVDIDVLLKSDAGIAFTTPSHQMPTGVVLSLEKRKRLLDWADAGDSYIIEDDYGHEFRYGARPVPPMRSFDTRERVIYIGSLSLTLSPALRMSYFVLPPKLLARYLQLFEGYRCMIPWLQQKIIALYMAEGYWSRRVNRVFTENRKKHGLLLDTIRKTMGDKVRIGGETGGSHIMLEVRGGLSQDELISRALQHNVQINSTRQFWHDKKNCIDNRVLIGFHAIARNDIQKGIELLAKAWFE